jgi:hypothetical protein
VAVLVAAIIPIAAAVAGRRGPVARRERAWEIEALGLAVLGIAWLVAVFA